MRLQYHEGKNFGDQLNPMIFDHFFPGYFQGNKDIVLMGIGSILGFHNRFPGKKIVFSSGFDATLPDTYGQLPTVLEDFDFVCVRGPKTANLLGLESSLAITDGAALLKEMVKGPTEKKYKVSLMPHAGSEDFYDHQVLCDELGWEFISPKWEVEKVLEKIQATELLITEAMHGAIVADTLRVPWIPYIGFKTIGTFKWEDWAASMELEYAPVLITPYFDEIKRKELVKMRLTRFYLQGLSWLFTGMLDNRFQRIWKQNKIKFAEIAKQSSAFLSKEEVLNDRVNRLLLKVEELKQKYPIEKFG